MNAELARWLKIDPGIPALSIRGPWWWFILHLQKNLENRGWPASYAPINHRGPFLIHAAKGVTFDEYLGACEFATEIHPQACFTIPTWDWFRKHGGAIVGRAYARDFIHESRSPWFVGPGAIVLDRIEQLQEPVQCRGALGYFQPVFHADFTGKP